MSRQTTSGFVAFALTFGLAASAVGADKVYWADKDAQKVERADRNGANRETVISTGNPYAVAVDSLNGKLYWSDLTADKILRSNLDGSNVQEIAVGVDADALALDVYRDKIYWTVPHTVSPGPAIPGKIHRANLDGTSPQVISVGPPVTSFFSIGLALDLSSDKMYWTELNSASIWRSNLDGTGAAQIATASGASGVAFDSVAQKVYWTGCFNAIFRANADGSSPQTIVPADTSCRVGMVVDHTGGKIYWNEEGIAVRRANLDGTVIENLATSGLASNDQIALDAPPEIPAAIPTVSTWGAVCLMLLLATGGTLVAARRSTVTT